MPTRRSRRIYTFDDYALVDLPISVRQYVKGLREYEQSATEVKAFDKGISAFSRINELLKNIDIKNEEAKVIIDRTLKSDKYYATREDLAMEATSLEALLNSYPSVDRSLIAGASDALLNDIDELLDRVWNRVRSIGFEWYEVMISSKF